MMKSIDTVTGHVHTEEVVVGPKTTLDDVRSWPSLYASGATNEEEGWYYATLREQKLGGLRFDLSMRFQHGMLRVLSLSHVDPSFGSSWDEYSIEKQRDLQAWHDRWLREQGVSGRLRDLGVAGARYDWGSISSGFDSKSGFASIDVLYGRKPNERSGFLQRVAHLLTRK